MASLWTLQYSHSDFFDLYNCLTIWLMSLTAFLASKPFFLYFKCGDFYYFFPSALLPRCLKFCALERKKNDSRLGKSAIFQSRAFTLTLPLIGLSKPIKPARTSFYTAVQVAKEESHWKNAGKNYTAYDLGIKDQNRSDQILSLPMYVKHNLYASIFELLHEQNKAFHPVLLKYLKTFSTLEYFCCLLYLTPTAAGFLQIPSPSPATFALIFPT